MNNANTNAQQSRGLAREWLINLGFFAAVIALAMHLEASSTFSFQSNVFAENMQSDGVTPMNTTFSFQAGGFTNGFVPTSANMDQWMANWQAVPLIDEFGGPMPANETPYTQNQVVPGLYTNNFEGTGELQNNNAPFQPASQGYIWGYTEQQGSTGMTAEWILVTNSNWRFPDTTLPPNPVVWGVGDAGTVAVLGQVNNGAVHMQSSQVALVPEPSVVLLLGACMTLLGLRRRRAAS